MNSLQNQITLMEMATLNFFLGEMTKVANLVMA